ncbi:MAG: uracil-DNA glycosylase [Pseudomonadota bacterium]
MRSDPREELTELIEAARTHVADQRRRGFRFDMAGASVIQEPARTIHVEVPTKRESLDEIRAELGDCTRCKLHRGRTRLVFGVGNPAADLVFVGEGPGRDEDLQGEPFVGRAGKLLTEIIEAIGLARSEVYICNVVKCRPPENRNPEPEEIASCRSFLDAQLRSIRPRIVCALGKFAAQTLLDVEKPISALRGKFAEREGIPVMVTYHPAYLLRNPSAKREVWEDMKQVHAELCRLTGRAIPRKGK